MNLHSAFACLLLSPLLAQEPDPAQAPARTGRPAVTVTLSFPGGSLAEFLGEIRRLEPRANIVMAPLAADAVLPPMELRGAGLDQALDSACAVAASEHTVRIKSFQGPGEPVYTILAHPTKDASRAQQLLQTQVFGLARLTADDSAGPGIAPTTVLSAVETAVAEPSLQLLRFHRDSGLMIVRGTAEQMGVVQAVLHALATDRDARRSRAEQREQQRTAPPAARPPAGTESGGDAQKPKEPK